MNIFKNTYFIFSVTLFILFSACTNEKIVLPQENSTKFVLDTKTPAQSGTTFRIMAFGRQQDNHFNYISSGTYCYLEDKEFGGVKYLSASELNDSGVFIKEDGTQALAIPYSELPRKNFFITYVSPGMIHSDGGFEVDVSNAFFCSDVQDTELNNYGIVEMNKELIDRRAKIGFRIFKDEYDIEVSDFKIVGAGNVYWPATKQITPKDDSLFLGNALKSAADGGLSINDPNLQYECAGDDMPFILSGYYAPKDTVSAHILNDTVNYSLEYVPVNLQESGYLTAIFNLKIGEGCFEMHVPLSKLIVELNPLTTYIYNITVKNTYIHTILEISPVIGGISSWENVTVDFEIKDNTTFLDLGNIEISGWDNLTWDNIYMDDPVNN